MNETEMKLLADMIGSMTAGGVTAFIWYLVLTHGTHLIMFLVGAALTSYVLLRWISSWGSEYAMHGIRDALRIGCAGHVTEEERNLVVSTIQNMIQKANK